MESAAEDGAGTQVILGWKHNGLGSRRAVMEREGAAGENLGVMLTEEARKLLETTCIPVLAWLLGHAAEGWASTSK